MCSLRPALGSSRAFNNPRLPEAFRPCNASIPDKRNASAFLKFVSDGGFDCPFASSHQSGLYRVVNWHSPLRVPCSE